MKTTLVAPKFTWNSKKFEFEFNLLKDSREDVFIELFQLSLFDFITNSLRMSAENEMQLYVMGRKDNISVNITDWISESLTKSMELLKDFDNLSVKLLMDCVEESSYLNIDTMTSIDISKFVAMSQYIFLRFNTKRQIFANYSRAHIHPLGISLTTLMTWKWVSYLFRNIERKNTRFKAEINNLINKRKYQNVKVKIITSDNSRGNIQYCAKIALKHLNEQRGILNNFIEIIGRIPTQDEMRSPYSFYPLLIQNYLLKKIPARHIEEITEMEDISWFVAEEGSWFQALINCGVLKNAQRKSTYGTWNLAKDGHVCKSIAEKNVDDWLFEHNVLHDKEVRYPNANFIADWKIENTYIELYGLEGLPAYDEKILAKRKHAELFNIKLVELYLCDVLNLESKLKTFI